MSVVGCGLSLEQLSRCAEGNFLMSEASKVIHRPELSTAEKFNFS
jgi:hypothetical protein